MPTTGALVVLAGHGGALSEAAARLDRQTGGLVARLLAAEPGGGKHGRVLHLPYPAGTDLDALVVLVAGKAEPLSGLDLEELGGTLVERLRQLRLREAVVASSAGLDLGHAPAEVAARLAHGGSLRGYAFDKYKSTSPDDDDTVRLARLELLVDEPGNPLATRLAALGEAVRAARDLMNEPANVLTPRAFADACQGLAELGVEVEILDPGEMARLGMRAVLAVGQGSAEPSYVVVMRWKGAEAEQPLALVGKGVCFDSGGISIKPAGGMEDMKFDMGGAAAVYGAIRALASRKAAVDVVGVVGLTENMVSGNAQRPGDVIRSMAGITIEVVNTDAEGRLVLADLLWYTKERFKPSAMIDLATLTGACVVALGHENAGLFANDEELAARLTAAGEAVGETVWRLPLGKGYAKHIKSDIADIKNVGRAREAGASAGAVFLERFVGEVPWAHLDIAGTAWSSRDLPLSPKGGTAFGLRLLERLVADHYEVPSGA
ncbi:MAG TPA: leucyl aminopeptidase [Geminicoccus sp.]|nr:leucyl aminopeptidase [Geminicoccus sp.]